MLSACARHIFRPRGGTPDTRSGVRPRVSFIAFVPSGIAGPASAEPTFRVLAEGDPDVDAALASAVGCSPPPRSLTPPRPPLSDQRGRAALPRLSESGRCNRAGSLLADGSFDHRAGAWSATFPRHAMEIRAPGRFCSAGASRERLAHRGKGGQPVWLIATPDRRRRGDAHLWRIARRDRFAKRALPSCSYGYPALARRRGCP